MARRVITDPPFKNITAATDFAHDESFLRHAHGFNKRDSKNKKARTAFAIRAFEFLAAVKLFLWRQFADEGPRNLSGLAVVVMDKKTVA